MTKHMFLMGMYKCRLLGKKFTKISTKQGIEYCTSGYKIISKNSENNITEKQHETCNCCLCQNFVHHLGFVNNEH